MKCHENRAGGELRKRQAHPVGGIAAATVKKKRKTYCVEGSVRMIS